MAADGGSWVSKENTRPEGDDVRSATLETRAPSNDHMSSHDATPLDHGPPCATIKAGLREQTVPELKN